MKSIKCDPDVEMKLAYYDCMERLSIMSSGIKGLLNCLDGWVVEAQEKYFSLGGSLEEAREIYQRSVDKSKRRDPCLKIVKGDFSGRPVGYSNEA